MRNTIHRTTHIGQVHLLVNDLSSMVEFYTTYIGLQVIHHNEQQAYLSADGTTVLIILEYRSDLMRKPPLTTGLYHLALLVPDRPSLALAILHLVERNYPLQGASDHYFSESLYLADPEGNGIEIYADRPREQWDIGKELPAVSNPMNIDDVLKEAEGKSWAGMPSETKMGHIHLHMRSITEAEQYYVKILGMDVMTQIADHALFISAGGYHHHIGLNTWNGSAEPPANSTGLYRYAIVIPDEAGYKEHAAYLKQQGYITEIQDGNQGITLLQDPSGHVIELRSAALSVKTNWGEPN